MTKEYKVDYYSILGFVGFAILTVFIWRFYYGYYILYPFTIMGTWFHEMGHGIMSMLVGGDFVKLEIFPNGSGLAHSRYNDSDFYFNKNIALSMVTAAGLFGPPIVGSILILMSKSFKKSKIILYILSISMLLSVAIWMRSIVGLMLVLFVAFFLLFIISRSKSIVVKILIQLVGVLNCVYIYKKIGFLYTEKVTVGVIVILFLGVLLLLIAFKSRPIIQQLVVQIIGIMACVDTYKQIGYLYTEKVIVGGMPESFSDTGSIANRLGMTYSFWGTLILIISFIMLIYSLYLRNKTLVE